MIVKENPKRLGGLYGDHQAGSVWDKEHISPIIDTMQGGADSQ